MSWPTKKLGEVLDYEQPGKYIVSSKNYSDAYKTPVLTAGKTFILGNTNETENIFPADKLPVIIFDDFTTAIKFVDFPFKVKSSAMKILHAKKGIADIKFLFYALQTTSINHSTHQRYWISKYSQIEIPLPPLSEQEKIVAKLEKVLGKIKEAKELRVEAQETTQNLLPAALHKFFSEGKKKGWKEGNIFHLKEDIEIVDPKKSFKTNFPYIDITSVSADLGSVPVPRIISKNEAPSRARKLVREGDTIFATTRPYLKKVAYISKNLSGSVASTGFCVIRPKRELIDPRYLFLVVSSDPFIEEVVVFQKGATYPAVSDKVIYERKILLPPLSEQKKIVAYLDSLSEKVQSLQKAQAETAKNFTDLEQSILHQAFFGKLV